jgi:pyruvyltransferase
MLPVYCWRDNDSRDRNFGDELGWMIAERLLGHRVAITHDKELTPKCFCVGTTIEHAQDGDVVWGCGARAYRVYASSIDIRAVRGPLTRDYLLNCGLQCPSIYGDAGLLVPQLFPEIERKSEGVGYVRHYSDRSPTPSDCTHDISSKDDPVEVIKAIAACDRIVSSSLHGIVLADAYGIPVQRKIHDKEPDFKYADYLASTGRGEEWIKSENPLPPPVLPDLAALIDAFPRDVFTFPSTPETPNVPPGSTIIATAAFFGFDRKWTDCLASQAAYADRHGYARWLLTEAPYGVHTASDSSWYKLTMILAALKMGCKVLWVDADCMLSSDAPALAEVEEPGKTVYMAKGNSDRFNAGVIYALPSPSARELVEKILVGRSIDVPEEDRAPYDNGHVIHYAKNDPCVGEMDPRWNNSYLPSLKDYIRHFTGPFAGRHV